ncbi:MAG: hypothetical protein JXA66_08465, partial [Oligoflexia bacterium]|nr:hypothetical protein [Oligoflexia bacterium]
MRLSIRTKLILLLFILMVVTILLISGQAYKVALKDMSNNAKANTRTYARNISKIIEERMQTVKEKILFAVLNEEIVRNGSTLIFKRSPEVLAIIEYHFPTLHSMPQRQGILLNPNYRSKYEINEDQFVKMEKYVDFRLALKDNEFI